jgi:hypothetical protein
VVIHYTVLRNCTEKGKKGNGIIASEGKTRMRERKDVGLKERNKLSG